MTILAEWEASINLIVNYLWGLEYLLCGRQVLGCSYSDMFLVLWKFVVSEKLATADEMKGGEGPWESRGGAHPPPGCRQLLPPGAQGQLVTGLLCCLHLIRNHSQEEGEKVTKHKVVSDVSVLQSSLGHFKEQAPVFLQRKSTAIDDLSHKMFKAWTRLLEILRTLLLPKRKTEHSFPFPFPLFLSPAPISLSYSLPPTCSHPSLALNFLFLSGMQALRNKLTWCFYSLVSSIISPRDQVQVQGLKPFKGCISFPKAFIGGRRDSPVIHLSVSQRLPHPSPKWTWFSFLEAHVALDLRLPFFSASYNSSLQGQ